MSRSSESEKEDEVGASPPGADGDSGAPIDAMVGARLRKLRLSHGLSARELASRAGVSPSYLSRLENGRFSPTISTLTRVVQAMGETVGRLFGEDSDGPVVRSDARPIVRNRGVDDYLLTPTQAQRLQVLETHVGPKEGSGKSYTHAGDEECILVLEGRLEVWLNGARYELDEGDAITFPCRTPHRWRNPDDEPAKVLWIITPPGY